MSLFERIVMIALFGAIIYAMIIETKRIDSLEHIFVMIDGRCGD